MSTTPSTVTTSDILEMLVVLLNETPANITPQAELNSLTGWDSMGVLLLMAELDERFGIMLKEEQIKSLKTIDDIIGVIKDRGFLQD